jgi:hypothetical protein
VYLDKLLENGFLARRFKDAHVQETIRKEQTRRRLRYELVFSRELTAGLAMRQTIGELWKQGIDGRYCFFLDLLFIALEYHA